MIQLEKLQRSLEEVPSQMRIPGQESVASFRKRIMLAYTEIMETIENVETEDKEEFNILFSQLNAEFSLKSGDVFMESGEFELRESEVIAFEKEVENLSNKVEENRAFALRLERKIKLLKTGST